MPKTALGRGLGALLGGVPPTTPLNAFKGGVTSPATGIAAAGESVLRVAIGRVSASALQPRKDFPAESLRELADSIREQGILQPLIVRQQRDGFELIAGERRWRAAQLLGLAEVPVIIRHADDPTVLELMLIENLQRENLNPIEEAHGYAQLIEQFQLRQEEAAQKVGKSRAVVANALRLLKLPIEIQSWVREGKLSVGHAKVIMGLDEAEDQTRAAEKTLAEGMSVRETEVLVAHWAKFRQTEGAGKSGTPAARLSPDLHVADLQNRLQERFGTKVRLKYRQGKGAIEIRFFNDDDLDRLLQIFSVKVD